MNNLKQLRQALNYSQKEMAEFLEISLSLEQKMELGLKNVSLNTIKIIKSKENDIKKIVPYFDYKIFLEEIIT